MAEYTLHTTQPRPYFAELPYYAWGQVNYDSEGDCKTPLDRNWTWIELTHRDTDEHVEVSSNGTKWTVSGDDPAAKRIAQFLKDRCAADSITPNPILDDWDAASANERAARVAAEFEKAHFRLKCNVRLREGESALVLTEGSSPPSALPPRPGARVRRG
jgi:hypothetical protein